MCGEYRKAERRNNCFFVVVVVAMADQYTIFFFPNCPVIKRRRQSKKLEVYPENKAKIFTIVSGKSFPEKRN